MKVIKTNDGYMVEQDNGDYLCDASGDTGAFESEDVMDSELVALAKVVALLDKATTIIYNMEGDLNQRTYEQLEAIINQLKGESK
jgi:hypothetical protein